VPRPKGSKNKPKIPDNVIIPTQVYAKEIMSHGGYKRTLIKCESFDFVNGSLVGFVPEKGDWNFRLERPLRDRKPIPIYSWNSPVIWSDDAVRPEDDPEVDQLWVGLGDDGKPDLLLIFFKGINNSSVTYEFKPEEDGTPYWGEEEVYDYYE